MEINLKNKNILVRKTCFVTLIPSLSKFIVNGASICVLISLLQKRLKKENKVFDCYEDS